MYVASKYRNIDLNNIDFVFGGSTLEMLAKHDVSEPFLDCRIPTATANHTLLLVEMCTDYTQDFAALYYQHTNIVFLICRMKSRIIGSSTSDSSVLRPCEFGMLPYW
jgi:hypothetical protein